ncbi:MAG: N-acetylglucosamine-6-phosphate deacetylase [Kiritimatiellae bacterium]|nr:N-acetylglucosamine-6-phosphate deacetylase [Kiritimatiellia bacterium]
MKAEWIDLQINGYGGIDFNAPGLTVDQVVAVTERLAHDGTAGYLPTFVTGDPDMVLSNMRVIAKARRKNALCEKNVIGVHLEGPFISDKPGAVGTHPIEWVKPPSLEAFNKYQDACEGIVKLVTVAAEVPGMPDFVKAVSDSGVTVSLGHQMASTPEEVEPCMAAGAKAYTHLGNGIPNQIPRHNNVLFTALADDRATVMFIPDGHHLPDTVLKVFTRAVPMKRLVAVSDAQYPAGMPPGDYDVCGAKARLEPSGLLWNPARNCLVGATTPMGAMMELLQKRVGLTLDECFMIGRDNPLSLIGL